jgi:Mg-chelatase subunit ChlI
MKPAQRVAIMERRIAFETDPAGFRDEWSPSEHELSQRIAHARKMVNGVHYTRSDLAAIATLTSRYHVDGHRGDLVILRGAQAHAAFEGREHITDRDILAAAELALPHRIKGTPFQQNQVDMYDMEEALDQARDDWDEGEMSDVAQDSTEGEESVKKKSP